MVDLMREEHQVSLRQGCKAVNLPRSSYSYQHRPKDDSDVIDALLALVDRHPSIGFWSCYFRIRNQGWQWNHKRIYRVYTMLGLNNIPNNGPIWPLSRYQYFRLGYLRYNPWPHSFFHASPYRFPFNCLFGETENSGSASCFACTKLSYRHELVHVVKM